MKRKVYVKPEVRDTEQLKVNESVAVCQMAIAYYQLYETRSGQGYATYEEMAQYFDTISEGDWSAFIWCYAWYIQGERHSDPTNWDNYQNVSFYFEDWNTDFWFNHDDDIDDQGNVPITSGVGTNGVEFIPLKLKEGPGGAFRS